MEMTDKCSESALAEANRFLRKKGESGVVLFATLTGSHAYNLASETSDLDYKGVWAAPAERFLGLLLPSESISCHSNPSANDPDITLYEAKHFCDLLLSSDPFALEMLFTDKYCYATEVWSELKSFRRDFLTVNAVDRYLSYCKNMLVKYKKPSASKRLPGKRIYHIFRLLYLAEDVISGREPTIWLEPGEKRQFLADIRGEKYAKNVLIEMADQRIRAIEDKRDAWSVQLPQKPREDKLDAWLMRIRYYFLHNKQES